jgi:hypothetical protein
VFGAGFVEIRVEQVGYRTDSNREDIGRNVQVQVCKACSGSGEETIESVLRGAVEF